MAVAIGAYCSHDHFACSSERRALQASSGTCRTSRRSSGRSRFSPSHSTSACGALHAMYSRSRPCRFSHAIVGLCTGAKIESIVLEPNEGGATRMRGGIPWLTLPAGYLGSSFIGAAMIACAFDIRASKVMSFGEPLERRHCRVPANTPAVIAVCFLFTLWWARKNWL